MKESPFADPKRTRDGKSQPGDVGFGYISSGTTATATGPKSPLKSALKVPGTPAKFTNPLSPTFREEDVLEKRESSTDKEQVKDVVRCL